MAFFPQVATGALAHYPAVKVRRTRSAQNVSVEGRRVAVADAGAASATWELRYTGLSTAERQAIEGLFAASEGRLGTFGFLDPLGNLLAYSEDFGAAAWSRDPLLQATGGFGDPQGGTSAFRLVNSGQAAQEVRQAAGGPATFVYCFSVWVRAASPGMVTLRMSSASASQQKAVAVGTAWRRRFLSGRLGVDETPVTFGVELAAGMSADVFGAQVDAQPAASAYRKTLARSGVYAAARFEQDELAIVAEGPGEHAAVVVVRSRL